MGNMDNWAGRRLLSLRISISDRKPLMKIFRLVTSGLVNFRCVTGLNPVAKEFCRRAGPR